MSKVAPASSFGTIDTATQSRSRYWPRDKFQVLRFHTTKSVPPRRDNRSVDCVDVHVDCVPQSTARLDQRFTVTCVHVGGACRMWNGASSKRVTAAAGHAQYYSQSAAPTNVVLATAIDTIAIHGQNGDIGEAAHIGWNDAQQHVSKICVYQVGPLSNGFWYCSIDGRIGHVKVFQSSPLPDKTG
jgi:hypothetical protein